MEPREPSSPLRGEQSPAVRRSVEAARSQVRSPGRPTTQESITSSRVFRDISPQKVWDAVPTEESRTSLPHLFKLKNGLQSLRPVYSLDVDALRKGAEELRQPKLLQSLEAFLDERMAMVNRVASTSKGYAATRMQTDAHRQVFDGFLHSFTTYRSLLTRIKGEYDRALDDALKSVFDHVHMQAELAASQEAMEAAIRHAKSSAMEDAASSRKEIQDELDQQAALAAEAEAAYEAACAETAEIKASIVRLKKERAELELTVGHARRQLLAASSFGPKEKPVSKGATTAAAKK